MKIYLVGGAVRDQLLGLPVTERDWVVVGGSAADIIKAMNQEKQRHEAENGQAFVTKLNP